MRINIDHETVYSYDDTVNHSAQYLRLTPAGNETQRVVRWHVEVPGETTGWTDAYGNNCLTLVVDKPVDSITIHASGQVETIDASGVLQPRDTDPPRSIFLRHTRSTRPDEALRDFAENFRSPLEADRLEGLHQIMAGLREKVDYRPGTTNVGTTAVEAFEQGSGVCQDHAHLFLSICRTLDIPARYVSGYLYDPELADDDSASHAWASAWVDDLGWVSFDISNECSGTDRHIGLAVGLDYADTAPIRGVRTGGAGPESMRVAVRVGDDQ